MPSFSTARFNLPYCVAKQHRDIALSEGQLLDKRLTATQDLAWALINSPAFLFNH
jgi:hypothetical protein